MQCAAVHKTLTLASASSFSDVVLESPEDTEDPQRVRLTSIMKSCLGSDFFLSCLWYLGSDNLGVWAQGLVWGLIILVSISHNVGVWCGAGKCLRGEPF